MKSHLHSLNNSLHQISGYAALLRKHPERVEKYTRIIESNVRNIDATLQAICQTSPMISEPLPPRLDTASLSGKKVLVVDDMAENREILKDIFFTLHCDVKSAPGGAEALETARTFEPDIICLDILMPGMNGYETAERLRENGTRAALIAISALKEERDRTLFDGWLPKPFTAEQIVTLLTSTLSGATVKPPDTFDLSPLSSLQRRDLHDAIAQGALSRAERLVESLEEGECKRWLSEKLSQIDFNAIENSIV